MNYIVCCCGGEGSYASDRFIQKQIHKQFPINGLKKFQQDFIYKQHLTMAHFDFAIVLNHAS